MKPLFDHKKLDVYCVELKFIAWIGDFSQDVSRSSSSELELVAVGSPLDFHGVEDRLKHPPWPPCERGSPLQHYLGFRNVDWPFRDDHSRYGIGRFTRPEKASGDQRRDIPGFRRAIRDFADRNGPARGRTNISSRINSYPDSGAFPDAERKTLLATATNTQN